MAKTPKVGSVVTFFQAIKREYKSWEGTDGERTVTPWFRGQSDASWRLIPSIHRQKMSMMFESQALRDFKLRGPTYLSNIPQDDLEWLFVMQHYGMHTRLLDWTENSLAALFFALEDLNTERDACVWMLDPWSLNHWSIKRKAIPTSSDRKIQEKYSLASLNQIQKTAAYPAAIRPVHTTPRIIAQQGVFTIHGNDHRPIDELIQGSRVVRLNKIVINKKVKRSLFRELYMLGVSRSRLFPELEGLCRELKYRHSSDFHPQRKSPIQQSQTS